MKILFNNYLGNAKSAQGIMINGTVRALRKFHNVAIAQSGKLVESNEYREVSAGKFRKQMGRYANEWRRLLLNLIRLRSERILLQNFAPDVVVDLYAYLSFSIPFLTKTMRIPHIILMDSPVVYERKRGDKDHFHLPLIPEFIEKQVLRSCDAVITISNDLRNYFLTTYLLDEDKIHVVPNGVDIDKFKPSVNGRKIISEYGMRKKLVLGFSGAFKDWHNIGDLLEIMDLIISRYPNVCFLLVGEGPEKKSVEDFIKSRCSNNIILTGYVAPQQMPAYISAMDITLAPYRSQGDFFYGSPMKIFEYMASAKPVITNRFGPIESVIQDEYNGFLVEPGNNNLFAQNIIRLIENRELRLTIGKRARETVSDKYTWKHRARAISEVCKLVHKKYKPDQVNV